MEKEEKKLKKPGWILFLLGIVFPAGVIGCELVSRMCALIFFDPLPTVWHVMLVILVPASNLAVWLRLNEWMRTNSRLLDFISAIAIGIAGFYTLLFLPLLPLSAVMMLTGLGLLPFGPLSALISALILHNRLRKYPRASRKFKKRHFAYGIMCALLLLVAFDARTEITRLGISWAASNSVEKSQKGIRLLRTAGDEEVLLRLCYFSSRRFTGLLSFPMAFLTRGRSFVPESEVREIFYRVTGEAFNTRPVPKMNTRWGGFADFQPDFGLGNTQVGERVQGLRLNSSTVDSSINHDAALAYIEWTMEFKNNSALDRETRATISLPPGAVVSRATLWVNGEEKEAAFAAKGRVVEAYRSVVRRSRDPLLVTSQGGDRVLVQAFPVPRNGGTIRYRLGITTPLRINPSPGSGDKADLMLPLIVERNFDIDPAIRHALWIEGKRPITTTASGLNAETPVPGLYRLKGKITDMVLSSPDSTITTYRNTNVERTWTPEPENPDMAILQTISETEALRPDRTMIVIDGSSGLRPYAEEIIKGLDYLRPSTEVGVIIASDRISTIRPAIWDEAYKEKVTSLIAHTDFVGGQDNAPALVSALEMLEATENGRLLWIHGPQPVLFESTRAALNQTSSRLTRLPAIDILPVLPGPNRLLEEGSWSWGADLRYGSRGVSETLRTYFENVTAGRRTIKAKRTMVYRTAVPDDAVETSAHMARLWARDETLRMLKADSKKNWERAVELGSRLRVITPAVGAVVLETEEQYKDNELAPAQRDTVPTIPEPEEWALMILSMVVIAWLFYQKRIHTAVRPS